MSMKGKKTSNPLTGKAILVGGKTYTALLKNGYLYNKNTNQMTLETIDPVFDNLDILDNILGFLSWKEVLSHRVVNRNFSFLAVRRILKEIGSHEITLPTFSDCIKTSSLTRLVSSTSNLSMIRYFLSIVPREHRAIYTGWMCMYTSDIGLLKTLLPFRTGSDSNIIPQSCDDEYLLMLVRRGCNLVSALTFCMRSNNMISEATFNEVVRIADYLFPCDLQPRNRTTIRKWLIEVMNEIIF